MPDPGQKSANAKRAPGMFAFLRERKIWWLLPLFMLLLLVGVIYLLAHMSSADTEMYPTTEIWPRWAIAQFC